MADDAEARFDAIGKKWIEDVVNVNLTSVPKILYHYTDAAGLHGMLSNHSIWLTDSRFLNDSTEGTHFMRMAANVIAKCLAAESDPVVQSFYQRCIDRMEGYRTINSFFFSLSAKDDDLSQWRGYAREGTGFTIGFNGAQLHGAPGEFRFGPIEYRHEKQQEVAERILQEMAAQLRKDLKSSPSAQHAHLAERASVNYIWTIDNRSTFSKHRSFKEEDEWRIAAYEEPEQGNVRVRASGLGLVPYVNLAPLGTGQKLPIDRIGIGPGFANANIKDAVRALCMVNGYAVAKDGKAPKDGELTIYFADTPYRRP